MKRFKPAHSMMVLVFLIILIASSCVQGTGKPTPVPATATASVPQVIRVAIGVWPPFISEEAPHYGVYPHIVTQAFAEEGITVEYKFFAWDDTLELVKSGEWDATMPWSRTPERESYAVYSELFVTRQIEVFFYRQDYEFDWKTVEDLQGHRIGLMEGYATTGKLTAARDEGLDLTLDIAEDELGNLKRLLAGEIDIFPCEVDVCTYLLRTNFTPEEVERITSHPKIWSDRDMHLLVSRQSPHAEAWVQAFDRGLRKLQDDGRYDQMLQGFLTGAYDETPAP